jgi:uracil-DNA glycosylase
VDVHALDVRAFGPLPGEGDESLDGLRISFEHGLDRSLPRVPRPAGEAMLAGEPPQGVAEKHALYASVDDEPAAHHADTLRALTFVGRLAQAHIGETFNFYRDGEGAALRRDRLTSCLAARSLAGLLLVGEAAGYRGARISGLPFTSERQVSGTGPAEASATIVHRVLAELGLEEHVLLWNLVPTHPHEPGRPHSNRPPTETEIAAGRPFVAELARGRRVLAAGRLAARALDATYVRHPSHGGANAFREGLIAALDA